jgi:hypothetical protein
MNIEIILFYSLALFGLAFTAGTAYGSVNEYIKSKFRKYHWSCSYPELLKDSTNEQPERK